MDAIAVLGAFFAKHTMLYLILLMCGGSFTFNVIYGNATYAMASEFDDLRYDMTVSKLEQKQDEALDKIYEFERRERKGTADSKDLERLLELRKIERQIQRDLKRLNADYRDKVKERTPRIRFER